MAVKKKIAKKTAKKATKKKAEVEEEEDEGGMSLDDAFADDDDVEYAKAKPAKLKKVEKIEKVESSGEEVDIIKIKASKPIEQLKRGDKVNVDGLVLEVDAHSVLIDHGTTREMAIECFDPKKDKDYEIRYFNDQVERTLEVYVLEEIIYNRMKVKKVEW